MPIRHKVASFAELGEAVIESFGDYKRRTAEIVYEELTNAKIAPSAKVGTPVDTGTLLANWRAAPGKTGTSSFIKNTGEEHSRPPRFDTFKYVRNWSVFTIYNNSPYVIHVNDGTSGNKHNKNFIQQSLAKAEIRVKLYKETGSANA